MEIYFFYVIALGVSTFCVKMGETSYNGNSLRYRYALEIGAKIGLVSFLGSLIAIIFGESGFASILIFLATALLAFLVNFIAKYQIVNLISLIGIAVFSILSWIAILIRL